MKKIYALLMIAVGLNITEVNSATWTVTNSGNSFTPSLITINLGDTVVFQIAGNHNVVEVTEATWNANGNTSNGGFTLPFGGGTYVPNQVKTYYFVCQPHASMGMKGRIIVNSSTGIFNPQSVTADFKVYPNPVSDRFTVATTQTAERLEMVDASGRVVYAINHPELNREIEVLGLKSGSYALILVAGENRRRQVLIVE